MASDELSFETNLILILGTSGMLFLTTAIVLFIYLYQRKLIKKKIEFQKIEDLLKKQELQSAYALIEGQESERKRIAKDLHDSLSSMLVTLNMYSDSLLKKTSDQNIVDLASKIKKTASSATDETRRISHNLDSGTLTHFGLETAIKDLIEAVNSIDSIKATYHTHIPDLNNKDITTNIYHIVQELINNTLKHARATTLHLELSQISYEYISLIYEDNGVGFEIDDNKNGIGLKNIESRVETLGGTLKIDSKTGKGVSCIIELPLYGKN